MGTKQNCFCGLRCIYYILCVTIISLSAFSMCSCYARPHVMAKQDAFPFVSDTAKLDLTMYYQSGGTYEITDTLDLERNTLYLPENITLYFSGGLIKNGIIVGNNTCLKCKNHSAVFDSVHIRGTWNVRKITSSLFKDLSYDNALKDVFALTNPKVYNKVVIDTGDYQVTATRPSDVCVLIESNTDVLFNGRVTLTPNGYVMYSIVRIEGEHISLSGSGCIKGDKYTHLNNEGSWGMGIFVMGGNDIRIKGLEVKDCWGDCIYITNNANNVIIDQCNLHDGRRQGISIISARDVRINNCTISGVRGTDPGYAIDVEPNKADTVMHVTFNNVRIFDCYGGILGYGFAPDSYLGRIDVKNCSVSKTDFCPMNFRKVNVVRLINCDLNAPNNRWCLICNTVDRISVNSSYINGERIKKDYNKNKRIAIDYPNKVVIH